MLIAGVLVTSACVAPAASPSPGSTALAPSTVPSTVSSTTSTVPITTTSAPSTTSSSSTSTSSSPPSSSTTTSTTSTVPVRDGVVCWSAAPAGGPQAPAFEDTTVTAGLRDPLLGMYGHAVAFGDVNDNGAVDMFVGTFADRPVERYQVRGATGPSPDRLLLGDGEGGFAGDVHFPDTFGRSSGAAFVDLDGDGDLDLVVSRNVRTKKNGSTPTAIYRNDGAGRFTLVEDSGLAPDAGGRSIGVLDEDGDGLPDLFIAVGPYGNGDSRLYRNEGDFHFVDVTEQVGLPTGMTSLGVATGDVDGDGDSDLFLPGPGRLFLDAGDHFVEADSSVFAWKPNGNEDDVAGASFGDVDRDGRLDLVVGQHFNSTVDFGIPTPVRLFMNRTRPGKKVRFEEVTDAAGLVPLPTKAPDVEIADIDNDGWPDIVTSASAGNGAYPAVFRGLGVQDGIPRFATPTGLGDPQYWVATPAVDVDRDGRLDIFALEFDPARPSIMFRNVASSGHWIEVSVAGEVPGSTVVVSPVGDDTTVLGAAPLVATKGYTAGVEQVAHIGLGDVDRVDVTVRTPGGRTLRATDVPADARIRLPDGCGSEP